MAFGVFGRGASSEAGEQRPDGRPRLPPGQRLVQNWPVLHYGGIPRIDLENWQLRVFGLVANEQSFTLDEVRALPQVSLRTDIHCVTTWSRYDNDWVGVPFQHIMRPTQSIAISTDKGLTTPVAALGWDRPVDSIWRLVWSSPISTMTDGSTCSWRTATSMTLPGQIPTRSMACHPSSSTISRMALLLKNLMTLGVIFNRIQLVERPVPTIWTEMGILIWSYLTRKVPPLCYEMIHRKKTTGYRSV